MKESKIILFNNSNLKYFGDFKKIKQVKVNNLFYNSKFGKNKFISAENNGKYRVWQLENQNFNVVKEIQTRNSYPMKCEFIINVHKKFEYLLVSDFNELKVYSKELNHLKDLKKIHSNFILDIKHLRRKVVDGKNDVILTFGFEKLFVLTKISVGKNSEILAKYKPTYKIDTFKYFNQLRNTIVYATDKLFLLDCYEIEKGPFLEFDFLSKKFELISIIEKKRYLNKNTNELDYIIITGSNDGINIWSVKQRRCLSEIILPGKNICRKSNKKISKSKNTFYSFNDKTNIVYFWIINEEFKMIESIKINILEIYTDIKIGNLNNWLIIEEIDSNMFILNFSQIETIVYFRTIETEINKTSTEIKNYKYIKRNYLMDSNTHIIDKIQKIILELKKENILLILIRFNDLLKPYYITEPNLLKSNLDSIKSFFLTLNLFNLNNEQISFIFFILKSIIESIYFDIEVLIFSIEIILLDNLKNELWDIKFGYLICLFKKNNYLKAHTNSIIGLDCDIFSKICKDLCELDRKDLILEIFLANKNPLLKDNQYLFEIFKECFKICGEDSFNFIIKYVGNFYDKLILETFFEGIIETESIKQILLIDSICVLKTRYFTIYSDLMSYSFNYLPQLKYGSPLEYNLPGMFIKFLNEYSNNNTEFTKVCNIIYYNFLIRNEIKIIFQCLKKNSKLFSTILNFIYAVTLQIKSLNFSKFIQKFFLTKSITIFMDKFLCSNFFDFDIKYLTIKNLFGIISVRNTNLFTKLTEWFASSFKEFLNSDNEGLLNNMIIYTEASNSFNFEPSIHLIKADNYKLQIFYNKYIISTRFLKKKYDQSFLISKYFDVELLFNKSFFFKNFIASFYDTKLIAEEVLFTKNMMKFECQDIPKILKKIKKHLEKFIRWGKFVNLFLEQNYELVFEISKNAHLFSNENYLNEITKIKFLGIYYIFILFLIKLFIFSLKTKKHYLLKIIGNMQALIEEDSQINHDHNSESNTNETQGTNLNLSQINEEELLSFEYEPERENEKKDLKNEFENDNHYHDNNNDNHYYHDNNNNNDNHYHDNDNNYYNYHDNNDNHYHDNEENKIINSSLFFIEEDDHNNKSMVKINLNINESNENINFFTLKINEIKNCLTSIKNLIEKNEYEFIKLNYSKFEIKFNI